MPTSSPTADKIFAEALLRAAGEERAAYLKEACGEHSQLLERVERLLRAHNDALSFLETPPSAIVREVSPTLDQSPLEKPGTQIGPYKLLQQIGEGGMGIVYMAEQHEPVKRRVALKIIKPGMDSRQVIARFEAERQALSLMDHPNIAKVLDAGTTDSGRPYFVMELVKGQPITQYCDEKHLTPRQRLELLLPVCQAIQHAHQKGIIHRDIKPTNILVAEYDLQPVPKVIDFGVAKATSQALTEKTMFTGLGQLVGTLEYMSPEQAKVNQLDIDTRSDIYSLGVLLYELLTGSTPFDRQRLRSAAFDEMLRIIREEEPPKPSTRLSDSHDSLPSISAQRHTEPAKLTKLVRGELDWIVMKALEKDRNRRYETANGFAADVQRYLADEPVQACPPSAGYRLRKFVRRNRGRVLAAFLVFVSLVAGIIGTSWEAVRATRAEHSAEIRRAEAEDNHQKARQAVDEYFTLVSDSKLLDVPGLRPLRKDLLEAALRYYQGMQDRRSDDPAVLADVAATSLRVAVIYHVLDRNDDCLAAMEAAMPLAEQLRRDYPDSVKDHCRLAGTFKAARVINATAMPKDAAAAERTLTRMRLLWQEFAKGNPSVEGFQYDIAIINFLLVKLEGGRFHAGEPSDPARGLAYCREAATILERQSQAHPELVSLRQTLADVYADLGGILQHVGQKEAAEQTSARMRQLNADLIAQFPNDPTYRARQANEHLAAARGDQNPPQETEKLLGDALKEFANLVTEFPAEPDYRFKLGKGHLVLAGLLAGPLNRPADASHAYRQGLEQLEKAVADFPQVAGTRVELGWGYRAAAAFFAQDPKNLQQAEELHRRDVSTFDQLVKDYPKDPRYHEFLAHAYRSHGLALLRVGRNRDAVAALKAAVSVFEKSTAEFPTSLTHREQLAELRELLRRESELLIHLEAQKKE
jgi:serine/threonine protein kinase/tetratricopeptide (TPR) repeat protein